METARLRAKTPAPMPMTIEERELDDEHHSETNERVVITRISPEDLGVDLRTAAPLARRRPISRVLWVTLCQSTPVRPRPTMSSRKPATSADHDQGTEVLPVVGLAPLRQGLHRERPVARRGLGPGHQGLFEARGGSRPDLHQEEARRRLAHGRDRPGGGTDSCRA